MGEDRWTGTLLDAPTPLMAELVWDLLAMAQGPPLLEARDRMPKDPKIARKALQIGSTPVPSNVSGARLRPHGLGMCHPSKDFKPVQGELRKCSPIPHQQHPTLGPQHSFPDPEPKLTILKATQKKGRPLVAPVPVLNPDPIAHLVGCSNEAPVIVE